MGSSPIQVARWYNSIDWRIMTLDIGVIIKLLKMLFIWLEKNPNVFDWIPKFDDKSKKFGVRDILDDYIEVAPEMAWEQGTQLNQGSEGACVGFAWTHMLISSPRPPRRQPTEEGGFQFAMDVYRKAQEIDEWDGNTSGTSILAAAKILKEKGLISEYRWCFNLDDIRDSVLRIGPVAAGVKWNRYLSRPFKNGLTNVYGEFKGAHAVLIDGYYPEKQLGSKTYKDVFRIKNSWGKNYGHDGSAYILGTDLQKLIDLKGEFCVGINKVAPKFNAKGFPVA